MATGKRRSKASCVEGDAACDVDRVAGQCTFAVSLCAGARGDKGACRGAAIESLEVRRPRRRDNAGREAVEAAIAALGSPSLAPGSCTRPFGVVVTLRHHGRGAGAKTVAVRGRARRQRVAGRLHLRCKPAGRAARGRALVATADYAAGVGALSTVRLGWPRRVRRQVVQLGADPVVRVLDGRVFAINRFGDNGDNVTRLDPRRGFRTVFQCSTGKGSNPHDLAAVGRNRAYLTRYEKSALWVVDTSLRSSASCGRFKRGQIDLGRFADSDGIPEADAIVVVGGRAFVTLQRLDENSFFTPTAVSMLAVIDTAADTLVDADPSTPTIDGIALAGTNPQGLAFDPLSGRVVVWSAADFARAGGGGIETVDPVSMRTEGFVLSEAALGGKPTSLAIAGGGGQAYVIVSTGAFSPSLRSRLVRVDLADGRVLGEVFTTSSFVFPVVANRLGEVWLADQNPQGPGIRIFDAHTGQTKTTHPIDVGLPPVSIAFLDRAA